VLEDEGEGVSQEEEDNFGGWISPMNEAGA
jgi:hypothetical protein